MACSGKVNVWCIKTKEKEKTKKKVGALVHLKASWFVVEDEICVAWKVHKVAVNIPRFFALGIGLVSAGANRAQREPSSRTDFGP